MRGTEEVREMSRRHFDRSAEVYDDSRDGRFVKVMYKEIVKRAVELRPGAVLDLGCGNGNILAQLAAGTDAALYGLDLSENMIREAAKRLGDKVSLNIGDAKSLPYAEDSFDLVICNASFHHYPEPEIVLDEVKRVLKKGGVFLLGDPTAPFWYLKFLNWSLQKGDSGDFKIYGKREIRKLLEGRGFLFTNWRNIGLTAFAVNAVSL